jgi:hypothetical protein
MTHLTVREVMTAFNAAGIHLRRLPGGPAGLTILEQVGRQSELTVGVYRSIPGAKAAVFELEGSWPSEGATGKRSLNVLVVRRLLGGKRAQPFPHAVRAALSHL